MKTGQAEPVKGDGIHSNSYLQFHGTNKLFLSDSSNSSVINPHMGNCSLSYTHKKMHKIINMSDCLLFFGVLFLKLHAVNIVKNRLVIELFWNWWGFFCFNRIHLKNWAWITELKIILLSLYTFVYTFNNNWKTISKYTELLLYVSLKVQY